MTIQRVWKDVVYTTEQDIVLVNYCIMSLWTQFVLPQSKKAGGNNCGDITSNTAEKSTTAQVS